MGVGTLLHVDGLGNDWPFTGTSAVTIRSWQGQTASYTLATNVSITKVATGQLSELAVGQTVQVELGHSGNTAAGIRILNT